MAEAVSILHIISPLKHVSPFDVNMAADAGYGTIASYAEVEPGDVVPLTQDMMFSRSPDDAARTGLFIGGKDAALALDMLEAARGALFPPFEISVFADPAGSFTTAAAMIAMVEKTLKETRSEGLQGARVQVYGATGVVGGIAGVIAAQASAKVTLVSHRDIETVQDKAADFKTRFDVDMDCAQARNLEEQKAILPQAEVVLAAGAAGKEILGKEALETAQALLVGADVNAVPPTGIAGVGANETATLPSGGTGIGALVIGGLKYKVQLELLKKMRVASKAMTIGIEDAFALARDLAK